MRLPVMGWWLTPWQQASPTVSRWRLERWKMMVKVTAMCYRVWVSRSAARSCATPLVSLSLLWHCAQSPMIARMYFWAHLSRAAPLPRGV